MDDMWIEVYPSHTREVTEQRQFHLQSDGWMDGHGEPKTPSTSLRCRNNKYLTNFAIAMIHFVSGSVEFLSETTYEAHYVTVLYKTIMHRAQQRYFSCRKLKHKITIQNESHWKETIKLIFSITFRDICYSLMPQSHPTTGPIRFLSPVRFLDSMGTRAGPVRASYGPRTEIFNVFHILRDPCGTRKGAVRQPYGHVRELTQPELAKLPHGRRIWPYGGPHAPLTGPAGAVHRLFTFSKPARGP